MASLVNGLNATIRVTFSKEQRRISFYTFSDEKQITSTEIIQLDRQEKIILDDGKIILDTYCWLPKKNVLFCDLDDKNENVKLSIDYAFTKEHLISDRTFKSKTTSLTKEIYYSRVNLTDEEATEPNKETSIAKDRNENLDTNDFDSNFGWIKDANDSWGNK